MSPRCTCNKFGDCSWFKPATCVQVNHQNGKCEVGEAPIGQNDCTGSSMGDLCQLQCPAQYKAEQFGWVTQIQENVHGHTEHDNIISQLFDYDLDQLENEY